MKNLKFRAFRIRDKKMYDVYNITFLVNGVGCNAKDENGGIGNTIGVNFNDCDPEFYLMQSTRLFDINNKEIFEGDIVEGIVNKNDSKLCQGMIFKELQNKKVKGVIMYSQFYGAFYFTDDDVTILFLNYGINDLEVIGNIYENEELITNN